MMVSKKKFRNAVDRNRVKRLMREMYRIHKHRIYEALIAKSKTAALAVIYTGTTSPDYKTAVVVFEKTIDKLIHEINHQ